MRCDNCTVYARNDNATPPRATSTTGSWPATETSTSRYFRMTRRRTLDRGMSPRTPGANPVTRTRPVSGEAATACRVTYDTAWPATVTRPMDAVTVTLTPVVGARPATVTWPRGANVETLDEADGTRPETATRPSGAATEAPAASVGGRPVTVTVPSGSATAWSTRAAGTRPDTETVPSGPETAAELETNGARPSTVTSPTGTDAIKSFADRVGARPLTVTD